MKTPFAIAAGLALVVGSARAQDAAAALQRAEHAYHGLRTLRASFVQVLINPMLGAPDTARGTLYLQPPRRFAMRFSDPKDDRLVVDGTWLWAYTPSTVPDQVIKQPAPQAGATTPNLFAQFVEDPGTRYAATYVGRDTIAGDAVDLVHLVPKVEDLPFRAATIAVSTTSGLLRRLDLVETSGQRRRLVLLGLEPNAKIPPAEFEFHVPHGVRVVTP